MQITPTRVVELDKNEAQEFEQEYWPHDGYYAGTAYFEGRESGPFLVNLASVTYETREHIDKYNEGWEGFRIDFTAEERPQIEHLASYQDDLAIMLCSQRALMYFHQSYLEWLIKEMARCATSPTLKKEG